MNPNPGIGPLLLDTGKVGPSGKNAVEEVFRNSLIWKLLGSYLNVGDLKACRLVDSRFHSMVMQETNFLERCLVSLKPHQNTSCVFGSTKESWKNVLLKFGDPGEDYVGNYCFDGDKLEWLDPLISNVESLSLRMQRGMEQRANYNPVLKRLLNAAKNLRALAMEPIFLTNKVADNFECEELLRNLEEFEILQPHPGWINEIDVYTRLLSMTVAVSFTKKLKNLQVLRSYYQSQRVPREVYGMFMAEEAVRFDECQILSNVLERLATGNRNTLKCVTIGELKYWDEKSLEQLQEFVNTFSFPSLEAAKICLSDSFNPLTVRQYLLTLPMLQELDLSVSTALPNIVLKAIGERSTCLRKLIIKSQGFKGTNWQFLKNTEIEEFQLELQGSRREEHGTLPSEALNCLPLTVRRLFLRGPLQSNPIPALARLNPALVTHLTFIDSGKEFADDTMNYIRKNFKMLRKLNVTNSKRVTDAGFVGSSSGPGSFSGIKGLKTLILRECGSISDKTLEEIRFLELRYLDISYNKKLTEKGHEGLLSNNPSLETLLMSNDKIDSKKGHMCASHPRLSSISYRRLKP